MSRCSRAPSRSRRPPRCPWAALTALQALQDAKVQPGDRVLVNGASSGVGVYAVQMAVALGAKVTGGLQRRNVELVRSLGAIDVIDYTTQDFTDTTERYDVIIDIVSTRPIGRCRSHPDRDRALRGRRCGGQGSLARHGTSDPRGDLMSPFVSRSCCMVTAGSDREDLAEIAGMVDAVSCVRSSNGSTRSSRRRTPCATSTAAHARGKVVVTV